MYVLQVWYIRDLVILLMANLASKEESSHTTYIIIIIMYVRSIVLLVHKLQKITVVHTLLNVCCQDCHLILDIFPVP